MQGTRKRERIVGRSESRLLQQMCGEFRGRQLEPDLHSIVDERRQRVGPAPVL
ncbi:hypothetical protein D3C83_222380 [compost metagenome]